MPRRHPRERTLTLEEFERMPEEDLYRIELVRGRVVREPRPATTHGLAVARVTQLLGAWVEAHGLGAVVTDGGFVLEDEPPTVRGPDVAFVSTDRIPPSSYAVTWWRLGPDLAVQVLSPGNRLKQIREKIADYFGAGSRVVWVVNPRKRTVSVHEAAGSVRELSGMDQLDGAPVLAGLRIPLPRLFRI